MNTLPATLILLAGLAASADPTPRPAQRRWGQPKAGLSVSVAQAGPWRLNGPMRAEFAIRNTGRVPATAPPGREFFGFLVIAQGKTAWYSPRIRHAETLADWPDQLAEGTAIALPTVDVARLEAFVYKRTMRFHEGYPAEFVGGKPVKPKPAGTFANLLKPGSVKVRYIAHLPRGSEGALRLIGPTLRINLGLENFADLPEPMRRKVLADVETRLRRDAFSAMSAHHNAVQIGRAAVATVRGVATDPKAPGFARMWAATALADIGGTESARVLVDCLADRAEGVRHVAAYHGVKLRDKAFDAALTARATSGDDPALTAWAIMGHLRFRKAVPPALMSAGVESKQWKARAAVAETIASGNPNRSHLPLLRKLVVDPNHMIRQSAAKAIGYVRDDSRATIDALMAALEMDGENARHFVAGALCRIARKKWVYSTKASKEDREDVLQRWRQWWKENRDTYR